MNIKRLGILAGAVILGLSSLATHAAVINLAEYNFNVDGTLGLAGVDTSGFNTTTGIGSIGVSITGVGAHTFDAFFDHEIDEAINTFFNESGSVSGTAAAGQSWEIDEPGWVDGDIYANFQSSSLDNGIGTSMWGPTVFPDDVSMAMGWDFVLGVGETALIDLVLSTTAPGAGGFYLIHTDFDSQTSIYLSSTLTIQGGPSVPEPSIILLMGVGLMGVAVSRRRIKKI